MDWFWRPTATPERVGAWLGELRDTAGGLVDAFRPGHPTLSPATRELLSITVTEVNGARLTGWVHHTWWELLARDDADELLEAIDAWARDAAVEGRPIDTTALDAVLGVEHVRSVRAVVAVAELASLVENTADGLWRRLTLRRPFDPPAAVQEAAVVAVALPLVAPVVLAAGAMRLAQRSAPPVPEVVRPDGDSDLVAELVADGLTVLLTSAVARMVLLRLLEPLVLTVRSHGRAATVRLTHDRVLVEQGEADDAVLVVEGGIDLLVELATRTLGREIVELTARPES